MTVFIIIYVIKRSFSKSFKFLFFGFSFLCVRFDFIAQNSYVLKPLPVSLFTTYILKNFGNSFWISFLPPTIVDFRFFYDMFPYANCWYCFTKKTKIKQSVFPYYGFKEVTSHPQRCNETS